MLNEYTFNLAECGLWQVIALVLWVRSTRVAANLKGTLRFLTFTFCVFGVSDYIEAHTGAWWRPWWLLLLKGSCVGALAWGFWRYYRIVPRTLSAEKGTPSGSKDKG